MNVRVPLIDRERARVDLREHVITTPGLTVVALLRRLREPCPR
jgi:hypothetical protein